MKRLSFAKSENKYTKAVDYPLFFFLSLCLFLFPFNYVEIELTTTYSSRPIFFLFTNFPLFLTFFFNFSLVNDHVRLIGEIHYLATVTSLEDITYKFLQVFRHLKIRKFILCFSKQVKLCHSLNTV